MSCHNTAKFTTLSATYTLLNSYYVSYENHNKYGLIQFLKVDSVDAVCTGADSSMQSAPLQLTG